MRKESKKEATNYADRHEILKTNPFNSCRTEGTHSLIKILKAFCAAALALACVFFAACPENFESDTRPPPAVPDFIPVQEITGIPQVSLPFAEILLKARITPAGATYRKILWSAETSGDVVATVQGNRLILDEGEGTVTLTATITNGAAPGLDYTQEFEIAVSFTD